MISSEATSGVTTYSGIDAIGDRLSQGTASSVSGWLIADLHGNIVAAVSPGSSPVYLDAYRYDAYGETVGSWAASSGSLTVPWRFQGRILESAAGGTDLYDFGARSYDPDLGDFTSFDSVAGSAQNPLTLNRYLYASANPATLVDPDGHDVPEPTSCPAGESLTYDGSYMTCVATSIGTTDSGSTPTTPPKTPTTPTTPNKHGTPKPYTYKDGNGLNWLVTPLVGGMAEYEVDISLTGPTYVPMDAFGDYVAIELKLTFKAGWSGGGAPPLVIHSDGTKTVIDTGNGTFTLGDVRQSGPVLAQTTSQTNVGSHWSSSSTSFSDTPPVTNGLVTTMDVNWTQSFETGSTRNGATVEIDAGLTFHMLRINLPPAPDPLAVPVAAGAAVGAVVTKAWPYVQQGWNMFQDNCPDGECVFGG